MRTTHSRSWRHVTTLPLALCLMLATALASAKDSVVFAISHTSDCVAKIESGSPSLGDHAVLACVGQSAQACMMAPGGDSTVGMMDCLKAEADYWDARMADAYAQGLKAAQNNDDELNRLGSAAASITATFEARQDAWLAFREAACRHEQALWMGGTGAGPATQACYLHETARHALRLEGWFSF